MPEFNASNLGKSVLGYIKGSNTQPLHSMWNGDDQIVTNKVSRN